MTVKVGINGFGRIGRLVFRTIKQRASDAVFSNQAARVVLACPIESTSKN